MTKVILYEPTSQNEYTQTYTCIWLFMLLLEKVSQIFIFYFLRDNLTKILEKILTQYFFYVLNHKFYLYMDFFHIKLDWISHMLLSMWKIYKIYIKNEFTLSTYVVFVI